VSPGAERRPDFVDEVVIRVDRARLRDFLVDLRNHAPLHPLIESIDEIEPSREWPGARSYRVVDRIPVGPFTLKATYVATLEPVSEREVHGHARQSPGVRLDTIYTLTKTGDARATRLEERVFVSAPLGLKRFVVGQARRSHATTLRRMKALLEQA
jgi:hypothetical protein